MNFTDSSRKAWATRAESATCEEIQIGCLQRIAAALEKLALPWEEIEREKRWRKQAEEAREYLQRRLNAQKGATTKAKRRRRR